MKKYVPMFSKLEERLRATEVQGEEFKLPSMVEPCYNPSIMEILMNPSLACVHKGLYDDGDDLEDVVDPYDNDIQGMYQNGRDEEAKPRNRENPPSEVGKPAGNEDEDKERSDEDEDELKQDPGTKPAE